MTKKSFRRDDSEETITELLEAWSRGEPEALDRLAQEVMDDVRSLAHRALAKEFARGTFQTTDLIDEVYLRLVQRRSVQWSNRNQFFGFLADTMRRILVDRARRRKATKRGGGQEPLALDESLVVGSANPEQLLAVHEALEGLERADRRQFDVFCLHFFVGLDQAEIGEVLELSLRTVSRDLRYAKIFLRQTLGASQ